MNTKNKICLLVLFLPCFALMLIFTLKAEMVLADYPTVVTLDCNDTSVAAGWYKSYGNRCGDIGGLNYWNASILNDGESNAYGAFLDSYKRDCCNALNLGTSSQCGDEAYRNALNIDIEQCNDVALCNPGDDYIAQTTTCAEEKEDMLLVCDDNLQTNQNFRCGVFCGGFQETVDWNAYNENECAPESAN